ncbi:MAG: transporter substrate-binding domain-containing protein [Candidatus Rokubacteria bacterium]|nr:transporter substrate-binding domain-containing protein [Candidatus Rokubacteria bacterium]
MIVAVLAFVPILAVAEEEGVASPQQKGYVRICADPSNLPFSSSSSGPQGFEVELATLVARDLGVEPRLEWILTWVRPVWELQKGKCDVFMGLPPSARFKASQPWIAVSRPYYTMKHALVVKSAAGIRGIGDLAGKRVAVDAGRPADYYLLEKGIERGIYKRQEAALHAVDADEAAAALLPLPIASWLARDKPALTVIPLDEPSLEIALGVATRASDQRLTRAVDQAIGRLLASGEVQEILLRYGAVPRP